jgi:hypothetical protein
MVSGTEALLVWRFVSSDIIIDAIFSLDFQENLQYFD